MTVLLSVLALNANGQNCTITLQSGSSNTSTCISSAITDIVYNTGDGATGIVSCTPLPAGVTAVWEAAQTKVRISGTPTESGIFDYTLTLEGGGGCTTTGRITVHPLPQGTLSGNGAVCPGGTPQLTWNATEGSGPYTIIYKENGGSNRTKTGVISGIPFIPYTTTINSSFTYTIVSVEDETTSCLRSSGFTGSSVTITVNPRPQGSVSVNGPFCGSGSPLLVWTASAGTGPYTIKYTENNGPERTVTGVASGVGFTPFTSPVTADTDYEITSVEDETTSCIRTSGFTDATASVDIRPLPADNLPVSGPGSVCMNRLLPAAVRIIEVEEVAAEFHPRFNARAKTYEYRIWRGEVCPPFERLYMHHFPYPMDVDAFVGAAQVFAGEHDFTAFAASDEKDALGGSKVRTIFDSRAWVDGNRLIYRVRGSGFLKHMVRNLVGTMIEAGKGNLDAERIRSMLDPGVGIKAGPTAPARGLFLVSVEY